MEKGGIVVALVLSLTACSRREAASEPEPSPRASVTESDASRPAAKLHEVKLLDAGQAPRAPLRFHPVAGTSSTIVLTFRGPWSRAATRLRVDANVASVTRAGDAQIALRVVAADGPDGGARDLNDFGDFAGSVLGTSRGAVVERSWSTRTMEGFGLQARFDAWIQELAPALPAEPIGVGARWRTEGPVWKHAYEAREVAEYRLVGLEGEGRQAIVEVDVSETAEPQSLELVNLRPEEGGRLLTMKGQGSARLELELDGPPLPFGRGVIEGRATMRYWSWSDEKESTETTRLEIDVAR